MNAGVSGGGELLFVLLRLAVVGCCDLRRDMLLFRNSDLFIFVFTLFSDCPDIECGTTRLTCGPLRWRAQTA
jgi:hypothetical protein